MAVLPSGSLGAPAPRRAAALGMLLSLALASSAASAPVSCVPGRFVVAGSLLGASQSGTDAIEIVGRRSTTIGGCAATAAVVKVRRGVTAVSARWRRCGSYRKIRIQGRIASPSCATFEGRLTATGAPPRSIVAPRTRCGDGVLDPTREACDGSAASGDAACPGACGPPDATQGCRCEPVSVPTTTTTTTVPPVPCDTCPSACAITALSIAGDTTTFAADIDARVGLPPACQGLAAAGTAGRDQVYRVDVPAGATLSAKVTPGSQWDPALYLLSSCDPPATSCLAGIDDEANGTPENLSYTNTGPTPRTVYVVVDSYREQSSGPFTLETTITP